MVLPSGGIRRSHFLPASRKSQFRTIYKCSPFMCAGIVTCLHLPSLWRDTCSLFMGKCTLECICALLCRRVHPLAFCTVWATAASLTLTRQCQKQKWARVERYRFTHALILRPGLSKFGRGGGYISRGKELTGNNRAKTPHVHIFKPEFDFSLCPL